MTAATPNYTDYELSDEHMRGTIHGAHPSLDPIRKAHFDAWLEAHDRRVKAEAWSTGYTEGYGDGSNHFYMPDRNPYRTEK